MKLYLHIEPYQTQVLFQEIYNMQSFLRVKLKILEYIKSCWHGNVSREKPFLCVDSDLDRVFLVNKNGRKVFSFSFGFNLKLKEFDLKQEGNAVVRVGYKNRSDEITDKMVSDSLAILSELEQREDNIYWNLDISEDIADEVGVESIRLFEYVMMQEAGYIRYDDAPQDEKLPFHPRFHFDVNYSSTANYKLGLGKEMVLDDMLYMLTPNTKCPYLQIKHTEYDSNSNQEIQHRFIRNKKKRKSSQQ